MVVGLTRPMGEQVPAHLVEPQANGKIFWEDACRSFKTVDFWGGLWGRNQAVTGVGIDTLPDGWRHWRDFEQALERSGKGHFPSDAETLERDGGRYLGFHRLTARRSEAIDFNLYDSGLGIRVGIDS